MFFLEAAFAGAQFAVLALLAGALATAGFILPGGEPAETRRALVRVSVPLLAAFLLAALGFLVLQGTKLHGGNLPNFDILSRYLFRTWSGRVWLAREAYAGLLLAGALWVVRREATVKQCRWMLLFSLPLLASRSLTSHSIAAKENLALLVSSDAVHLVATALWARRIARPFLCSLSRPEEARLIFVLGGRDDRQLLAGRARDRGRDCAHRNVSKLDPSSEAELALGKSLRQNSFTEAWSLLRHARARRR